MGEGVLRKPKAGLDGMVCICSSAPQLSPAASLTLVIREEYFVPIFFQEAFLFLEPVQGSYHR